MRCAREDRGREKKKERNFFVSYFIELKEIKAECRHIAASVVLYDDCTVYACAVVYFSHIVSFF